MKMKMKQKEEIPSSGAEQFKMQKFKNVPSKIKLDMEKVAEGDTEKREFLRRGTNEIRSRAAAAVKSSPRLTPRQRTNAKPTVPRANEPMKLAPRKEKNFVGSNVQRVEKMTPGGTKAEPIRSKHESYGQVPLYLQERQAQWADEEERRIAEMPDKDCPPGMTLMPEAERLETLRVLTANEVEVQQALFKMPLQIATPSLKKRKESLEAKLQEIEAAKKIFSRPKVYVEG